MKQSNKKFNCPLCGLHLTEVKYYEIVGVLDEKAKAEMAIRKELAKVKQQQKEIIAKRKAEKRKFEQDKKIAIKDGIEKGKQKEKSRADSLSKLVSKKSLDLQNATQKIKELEKHLKAGTTPQTAGLDFEKELTKQLGKEFPTDKIEMHGKGGDILHRVNFESKEIGSILYECKKTSQFLSDYVHQTKRAVAQRSATYGVLVTFATRKNSQGFFVENDIIVVHPYGTIHIAQVLRNALLERHSLKLNHEELEERSQNLMNFIKSDDFKNSVNNTIYRTEELAKLLILEHKEHLKNWKKRFHHYKGIHGNTKQIEISTKNILSGVACDKKLIMAKIKALSVTEFMTKEQQPTKSLAI